MELNGFKIDKYNQYGIPEGAKDAVCPKCSADRKKSTKKCVLLDWETGFGTCQHCREVLQLHTYTRKQTNFFKPKKVETPLKESFTDWFENRGISKTTLGILGITESIDWMPNVNSNVPTINFNYFRLGELINIKYRDIDKNFKMVKDAEKIFYNLDNCMYDDEVAIVEGEIDCASFVEAGIRNVISVPNGFSIKNVNLDYIDGSFEYFKNKKKIYLALDNDEAGLAGQKEMIRRFGAGRCLIVDFKDCKDANEYLVKYGKDALLQTLVMAEPVPLSEVSGVKDFEGEFEDYLLNGMQQGYKIGNEQFDSIFSTYTGQYIVVTGVPSSGKSDWVDEMMVGYNKLYGWKVAYASKENKPNQIHAGKLIAKLSGQWITKKSQMEESWFEEAKQKLHDDFKFIDLKDSYDLESVLKKGAELVERHGIKVLVIDPYNKVKLKSSKDKTTNDYTNDYFNLIDEFCTKYDVLVVVVAHPVKVMPHNGERPEITAYHIKGGGEIYDMTPHILLVDREYEFNSVFVKVLKVKFHHLGKNNEKRYFKWNVNNGRFSQYSREIVEVADISLADANHDDSNWMVKNIDNKDMPISQEF